MKMSRRLTRLGCVVLVALGLVESVDAVAECMCKAEERDSCDIVISYSALTRLFPLSQQQSEVLQVQQSPGPAVQRSLQLVHDPAGGEVQRLLRQDGPGHRNS